MAHFLIKMGDLIVEHIDFGRTKSRRRALLVSCNRLINIHQVFNMRARGLFGGLRLLKLCFEGPVIGGDKILMLLAGLSM